MINPIQVTPLIYLVGSGEIGLSEDHDCHVYLINCGEQWALIDSGAGIDAKQLTENIKKLLPAGKDLTHLFLTHCHADHAGGAARLQSSFNLSVIAGMLTSTRITIGEEAALALDVAKREDIYPADYIFDPPTDVQKVSNEGIVKIGSVSFLIIETPGHSADSVSYLVNLPEGKFLFAGDTIFASGHLPLLNTFDSSLVNYRASIAKMANLAVDGLCPGHGLFKIRNAHQLVKDIHQKLEKSIYIPPIIG